MKPRPRSLANYTERREQRRKITQAGSAGRSRLRKWWFRGAAAVGVPLLLLAGLEGSLQLCGYGFPTSFFLQSLNNGPPVLTDNYQFGWRFFPPAQARTPRPMRFSAKKAPNTIRIFVFGESAAYGDPQPEYGLSRMLELLLQERFPESRFEVINAAMTGINSHVILPIARDCAEADGDLWVLYMGNNEVVGPFGAGTIFGARVPSLSFIRFSLALRSTRLGQWLAARVAGMKHVRPARRTWEGLAMFLENQVRPDDPRMGAVYSHFARNLADIINTGRRHGTKIVVSTVLSNLKDCPPFASEHRVDFGQGKTNEWAELFRAGIAAQTNGKSTEAVQCFERAARIDETFAELQFRWGQCCASAGEEEQARKHFVRARDLDSLRFRADSRINQIIRDAVTGREAEGIRLADSEQELARQTGDGLPGRELLCDHVHATFEGNYRLARAIGQELIPLLPKGGSTASAGKGDWLSLADCAQRLAWTGWDRYRAAKSLMLRLNEPPFTSQLDFQQQYQRLAAELEKLAPVLRPTGLQKAAAEYRAAVAAAPNDWVLQKDLGELLTLMGDLAGAEKCCRAVAQTLPHDPGARLELGSLLVQSGRANDAIAEFQAALRLRPNSVSALNGLGFANIALGRQTEAVRLFQTALSLDPYSSETHLNLATALQGAGQAEPARTQVRLALTEPLKTPEALVRLAKVCLTQGWVNEALTNLSRAVRLNPADATAHYLLGGALDGSGRYAEALQEFSDAVRLNPDLAGARLGFGLELSRLGRGAEAAEQLATAVQLNPNSIEARLRLGAVLSRLGRIIDARAQFEQVLRLDPQNRAAKDQLERLPP